VQKRQRSVIKHNCIKYAQVNFRAGIADSSHRQRGKTGKTTQGHTRGVFHFSVVFFPAVPWDNANVKDKKKSKAMPVTGRGGLYGCEMLRIQHLNLNLFAFRKSCTGNTLGYGTSQAQYT
jgi:hypothetical protein